MYSWIAASPRWGDFHFARFPIIRLLVCVWLLGLVQLIVQDLAQQGSFHGDARWSG